LRTAQSAYAQGDYDSCASRAYFAVFRGETAVLIKLTEFRQERWGHDRVQEEFNRRLIRARKLRFRLRCSPSIMTLLVKGTLQTILLNPSVHAWPSVVSAKRQRW
jgi:hypothetical protein